MVWWFQVHLLLTFFVYMLTLLCFTASKPSGLFLEHTSRVGVGVGGVTTPE